MKLLARQYLQSIYSSEELLSKLNGNDNKGKLCVMMKVNPKVSLLDFGLVAHEVHIIKKN